MKAPKDFAKSTVYSFIFPIWLLCMWPDIRIILAGPVLNSSTRRLRAIRMELESNRKLISRFGKFKSYPWHDAEFTIAQRRNKSLADGTMKAAAIGTTFVGSRADVIIGDDIITLENAGTPERRIKVEEWFWEDLGGCREPCTPFVLVGTRKHYGDLYGKLEKNKAFYVPREYERADYVDEEGNLRSYWPELWSARRLKGLMTESRSAYDRDRRNMPMSAEDSPFPEDWLAWAKEKGLFLEMGPARQMGLEYVVQAWDVAGISSKVDARMRGTNYYACATIGINQESNRVLAEIWRQRGMTPRAWVAAVKHMAERHEPDIIIVETNGVQEFHRMHAVEETHLPIRAHNTTYLHKVQLKNRTASLAVQLENGKYVFPYKGDVTKEIIDELCHELNQFGAAEHSDMAMALFMADEHLKMPSVGGKVVAHGEPRQIPPTTRVGEGGTDYERPPIRTSPGGHHPWR